MCGFITSTPNVGRKHKFKNLQSMTNPSDNIKDGYQWIAQTLNNIRENKWVTLKVHIPNTNILGKLHNFLHCFHFSF